MSKQGRRDVDIPTLKPDLSPPSIEGRRRMKKKNTGRKRRYYKNSQAYPSVDIVAN